MGPSIQEDKPDVGDADLLGGRPASAPAPAPHHAAAVHHNSALIRSRGPCGVVTYKPCDRRHWDGSS
jgi:hypothetical protein